MNRRGFFQTIAGAAVAIRHGDWAAFKQSIAGPSQADITNFYYKKKGLAALQKKFVFREVYDEVPLPLQGRTITWFHPSSTRELYTGPEKGLAAVWPEPKPRITPSES